LPAATEKLFLPGFGAMTSLYRPGLPAGWTALEPPGFRRSDGSFLAMCRWLVAEIDRRSEPVELAGHSMGGALAIVAAAARPERVRRLTLISPAGLPLVKPMTVSLAEFVAHVLRGRYPLVEARRSAGAALRAPADALRLARAIHDADLRREMAAVRSAKIDTTVVTARSDTLVTADHCRQTARLLGARYQELPIEGGHMWMLERWPILAQVLDRGGSESRSAPSPDADVRKPSLDATTHRPSHRPVDRRRAHLAAHLSASAGAAARAVRRPDGLNDG
jgi:pimeloyl-ACP methyl ester carboxylesterase